MGGIGVPILPCAVFNKARERIFFTTVVSHCCLDYCGRREPLLLPEHTASFEPVKNPTGFGLQRRGKLWVAFLRGERSNKTNQQHSSPDAVIGSADAWLVIASYPQLADRSERKGILVEMRTTHCFAARKVLYNAFVESV
jgi:hypothetical protein